MIRWPGGTPDGPPAPTGTREPPETLAELARALPPPSMAGAQAVRRQVLAAADQTRTSRGATRGWLVAAVLLCAVGASAFVWRTTAKSVIAQTAAMYGNIQAAAGARFVHERVLALGYADEIVRLQEGRISVQVRALAAGDRFRVVTGDAEIEVRGTSFDVVAEADLLRQVIVHTGKVHVRPWHGLAGDLSAGQRWRPPVSPFETLAAAVSAPRMEAASPALPAEPVGALPIEVAQPARRGVARGPLEPQRQRADPGGRTTPRDAPGGAAYSPQSPFPADEPSSPPAEPPLVAVDAEHSPAEAAWTVGWHALRRSEFDDAAAAFAEVLRYADQGALAEDAGYWRAIALSRARRTAQAKTTWRQFLSRHPTSRHAGEARTMLGWMLLDDGAIREALTEFEAAAGDPSAAVRASAASGRETARRRLPP